MTFTLCRECNKKLSDQTEIFPNCGIKNSAEGPGSPFLANAASVETKPERSKAGLLVAVGAVISLVVIVPFAHTSPPPASPSPAEQTAQQNANDGQVAESREPQEPAEVFNAISVDDFMVDSSKYTEQTVSVRGMPICLSGTLCYLYSDGGNDMHSVIFDPTKLSHDDRDRLFSCNSYTNKCSAVITAHGIEDPNLLEMAPTRIDWLQRPTPPAGQ